MCKVWNHVGEALKRRDNDVNNMHGWFHKFLMKTRASQQHREPPQPEEMGQMTKSASATSSFTLLSPSLSSQPKTPTAPTKPPEPQSALTSPARWTRKYDVFVCYSSVHRDTEEASRLVSFLEASPRSLRCFLWHRDSSPGAAIPTELCQAVQDSHCRALLITPDFLQDQWCKYVMHQALAEAPMSHRMIPLVQNLSYAEYPLELKFYFYIDLRRKPDQAGYSLVSDTVLKYLENLAKNERTLDCNMDSSSKGFSEADSSQEDQQMSKCDPSETSGSLEMRETTNEGFTDVCWNQHEQ